MKSQQKLKGPHSVDNTRAIKSFNTNIRRNRTKHKHLLQTDY